MWTCDDCGWQWYLPDVPPDGAECDNCGGELVFHDTIESIGGVGTYT